MSKRSATPTKKLRTTTLDKVKKVRDISEYKLSSNGMRVLFAHRPDTGVVTSNILYHVGSRDEGRGETGIAHMLEHMLFKPTTFDTAKKQDAASMRFEREYGIILNANTWKDRTTYYFSYPTEHFDTALRIEAERMQSVVLTDEEFKPERTNVLSEFDMYAGDEQFSLAVEMAAAAFQSHTYGHETIGFRQDIEAYTTLKLKAFYENFYAPDNAVIVIVGDISERKMKERVIAHFGGLKNPLRKRARYALVEPKQEGRRRVEIKRPSKTNVFAIGVKHEGFPTKAWFETMTIFDMLAGGSDSLLYKELIDSGLASKLDSTVEPSYESNLGIIFVTLSPKLKHSDVEKRLLRILGSLKKETIVPYLRKTIAKQIASELTSRENSLGYAAELIEYVSAGAWEAFFNTESILKSITPEDILKRIDILFKDENTTQGYFIGTEAS